MTTGGGRAKQIGASHRRPDSLSYDASVDQYVYVWKTDKAWTGCRQLVVKLIDGMEYRANFKFTK